MSTGKQPQGLGQGHPRQQRVRFRAHYLKIQGSGRRVHTPHFVLLCLPSERRRLGITVTRRVAGAVGRNRVRRLCREVFRRNPGLFPERCDIVMVARAGAHTLDYQRVQAEVAGAHRALGQVARKLARPMPAQGAT